MNRNKNRNIHLQPSKLEFAIFSSDEIRKLSVVKVTTGLTFDPLGHPYPGGLYDDRMGGYGRRFEVCGTCRSGYDCAGHIGHIELTVLVYNPFFTKLAQRILNVSCLHCFKIQMTDNARKITELQLRLADAGYVIEAQEMEFYKSENVFPSASAMVKSEDGSSVHSRIAELEELLRTDAGVRNITKTNCDVRSAIVNAALQRSSSKKCKYCAKSLINVRYLYQKLVYYMTASELRAKVNNDKLTTGNYKIINASECRNYLRKIYENHAQLLNLIVPVLQMYKDSKTNNDCPVDLFFNDTLIVTPPNARPAMFVAGKIVEHTKTSTYRTIIQNDSVIRVILNHIKGEVQSSTEEATQVYEKAKGSSQYEKLYIAWQELQTSVNLLLDANVARNSDAGQGLKQVLEKKEGLLRKHMMGKRVNYAARTVITPDPNISVDEIGIPDIFAKKLSYPVPVTPWNIMSLKSMVINGPNVYPGANFIQDEKGYITLIPAGNPSKRESMAKLLFNYPEKGVKTVHRHVKNGDILLLNRQPSLHKPSIMAHKARILLGEKTFRLHYSNCKAYNADFDGDEMNAHLPQNEVARSEAYNLVNVANNYLVPKDGTPLGGLIQDHVISGVKLSIRGRFFNREDYHQLVYQGLSGKTGNIKLLRPTILKPKVLWSGKQILSTIIINLIPEDCPKINMQSTSKIQSKQWQTESKMSYPNFISLCESSVWIRNGELLMGVLDKQQYGATTYGLIHCIYELYGGNVSTILLTAFTKVFTYFLQREGFTLGVEDILVTGRSDHERRKIIKECREEGPKIVANALNLEDIPPLDVLEEKIKESYRNDPKFRVVLDRKYKAVLDDYTNRINKICLPDGLIRKFPSNNLQLMILSGAKGSLVNSMQISCLLGQIELEGKRPPLMISGKSLPSFTVFETSPKSGGFIDGRFMTGIQPQDFFFHCMAGREGLIDTAVKTSRSGYLQRCLIKHFEGLSVNYDLTVRDSDNSVIQFLYGEDGLDILKSKFFSFNSWKEFFLLNQDAILDKMAIKNIKDEDSLLKIKKYLKKLRSKRKNLKDSNKHYAAFTNFSAELRNEIEIKDAQKMNSKTGRRRLDEGIINLWKKADTESKQLYKKKCARCPDPVTSKYKPDLYYGSVPESLQSVIDRIQDPVEKEELADLIYVKAMKALASPGEPVGLLAAQSIGEPSTQMTLNTFHFAGRGEMNVTLGIPRLREILMTASSNIKTPSMDIPILPTKMKNADKLRIKLNRVSLADVLQDIDVRIKIVHQPERGRQYELCFRFLPREAYHDEYCIKPKQIIKYMSDVFFKQLFRSLIKSSKNSSAVIDLGDAKEKNEEDDHENEDFDDKKNTKEVEKDNSDDENRQEDDDDDATGIKLKSRKIDETEYDDPEEVEEAGNSSDDDESEPKDDQANSKEVEEPEDVNKDEMVDKVMQNTIVPDYVYDKEKFLWCKLTFHLPIRYKNPDMSSLLKNLAEKSVIYQVPNIKRSIIYKGENDDQFIKTDGINIIEMFKHNKILNLNRLYANDIHAIARTYGIEATARVIIKEVANVFKVYGIDVDRRHLSLIADYMTFDGTFKPLSRKGMEFHPSPLQQMSFEASLQFLKAAAHSGRCDDFDSPSSRIMAGLHIRNGTGAFELFSKTD